MATIAGTGEPLVAPAASIALSANLSLSAFQRCLVAASAVHPRELSKVEDQLARFSTWASSIGVFAPGRASMDHRLRYTLDVQGVVMDLLDSLSYRIEACTEILNTITNKSQVTDSPELEKTFDNIADEISHLNKISNTIRKASKETQHLRASNFQIKDDEGNDIESLLLSHFKRYVEDLFPGCSKILQARLANAMLLRRKRILYRRHRQGNSSIQLPSTTPQAAVVLPSGTLQDAQERQKAAGSGDAVAPSRVMTATTLASKKFQMASSSPSVVSASKTVALVNHQALVFPPAPGYILKQKFESVRATTKIPLLLQGPKSETAAESILNHDLQRALKEIGEITCPYCLYAMPAQEVFDERRWQQHVKSDLDAYICLFEDCSSPEVLYSHHQEWLDHLNDHSRIWRCLSHPELSLFTQRDDYIKHIRDMHSSALNDAQIRALANKNSRKKQTLFPSCPLCGNDEKDVSGRMEDHITGHLRSLALKSLPSYEVNVPDDYISKENSAQISNPQSRSTIRDGSFSDHESEIGQLLGINFWRSEDIEEEPAGYEGELDPKDLRFLADALAYERDLPYSDHDNQDQGENLQPDHDGGVEMAEGEPTHFNVGNAPALSKEEHAKMQDLLRNFRPVELDPIQFHDAVGRDFTFEFDKCIRWQDMEGIIKQLFARNDYLAQQINDYKYILLGPGDKIILPSEWEQTVRPGWSVSMELLLPQVPDHLMGNQGITPDNTGGPSFPPSFQEQPRHDQSAEERDMNPTAGSKPDIREEEIYELEDDEMLLTGDSWVLDGYFKSRRSKNQKPSYMERLQQDMEASVLSEESSKALTDGAQESNEQSAFEHHFQGIGSHLTKSQSTKQPEYTRLRRKDISLETLRENNIDFEVESDEFVVAKQQIRQPDFFQMKDHTSMIRRVRQTLEKPYEYEEELNKIHRTFVTEEEFEEQMNSEQGVGSRGSSVETVHKRKRPRVKTTEQTGSDLEAATSAERVLFGSNSKSVTAPHLPSAALAASDGLEKGSQSSTDALIGSPSESASLPVVSPWHVLPSSPIPPASPSRVPPLAPQPPHSSHSESRSTFVCLAPECDEIFDAEHKLEHHYQRYHAKDHKCPYPDCGEGFRTENRLQHHIDNWHEKTKPLLCSVEGCEYSQNGGRYFHRKEQWKRHMKRDHQIEDTELPEPIEVDLEEVLSI